ADGRVMADEAMTDALTVGREAMPGVVVSTDLLYDERDGAEERWLSLGATAVEMETATLLALAPARSLRAASLLLVCDLVLPVRERIEPDALRAAELRLGEVALSALTTATA